MTALTSSGRARQGTVTVHFRVFRPGSDKSMPLRQWMILVQVLIQTITALTTRDEVGVIVGGNGWLNHGIKLVTWISALVADKVRVGELRITSHVTVSQSGGLRSNPF